MVVLVEPVLACPHYPMMVSELENIVIADRHRDEVRNIGAGDTVVTRQVRDLLSRGCLAEELRAGLAGAPSPRWRYRTASTYSAGEAGDVGTGEKQRVCHFV
jgi:hypothetical protein